MNASRVLAAACLVCLLGGCGQASLGPRPDAASTPADDDGAAPTSLVEAGAGGAGATGDAGPAGPRPYRALSVVVGFEHSCALLDNHRVKCWGFNRSGQLGLGDGFRRGASPTEMGDALPFVDLGAGRTATALTAGNETTCALLDDGTVKCWGLGELTGLPSAANIGDDPGEMGDALPALDLGAGRKAVAVVLSATDGCAVLDDGTARCWGAHAPARVPSPVPFAAAAPVRSLVPAGQGILAVYQDGRVAGLLNLDPPAAWSDGVAAIGGAAAGMNGGGDGTEFGGSVWVIRTDGRIEIYGFRSDGTFIDEGDSWELADPSGGASPVALSLGIPQCAIFESGPPRCVGGYVSTPACTPDWCRDYVQNGSDLAHFHLELGHPTAAVTVDAVEHSCFVLSTGAVRCLGVAEASTIPNDALGSSFDLIDTNGQYSWGPYHDIDLGTAP
jgi:hypothetical protein